MTTTETISGIRARRRDTGQPWKPTCSAALDLLYPPKVEYMDIPAMKRGERCHEWMKHWLLHQLYPDTIPMPTILEMPAEQRRVNAAVDWYLSQPFRKPHRVEESLWSRDLSWSGTPDAIVITTRDLFTSLDWKFAETIQERYHVQAHVYRHLLYPEKVSESWLIQIPEDCSVRVTKTKSNPLAYAAFLSAVNVLNYRLRRSHG